jgi:hypothetical protein
MKKIILLTISCIFMLSATAQISATIVKKTLGQNIFICTTLTNNSGYPIHVIDGSMIGDDGGIESNGSTYIVFSSYDVNNNLLETSKKIPFTLSVPGIKRPVIKFPVDQSWSSNRILFTTIGCVGIFSKEINTSLKYIKAKVHVCYAKPDTDESFRELDIDVSQITL